MKYGVHLITGFSVIFFVLSSMFGIEAYSQARQLTVQTEMMTVRTRMIRKQVGELEKKVRMLQRVKDFVDHARNLQLTPQMWMRYDVTVEEAVTFRELASMIEQCVHNKDLYFKPISFQISAGKPEDFPVEASAVRMPSAGDTNEKSKDVTVAVKGAFWVKQ